MMIVMKPTATEEDILSVIDRIEMTYRAKPNFKGSAKVCVMGLT